MRKATRTDIKYINKLTDMAKSIMKNDQNPQWDDQYPSAKDFYNDIDNGHLYLYEIDDQVVGYVCINQEQANWYNQFDWPVSRHNAFVIHRMATDPNYKGVAQILMQFAIDQAKEAKAHIILTDTFSLNKRAQNLFKKFDFQWIGEYETDEFPFNKNAPFYAYYKLIDYKENK